MTDKPPPVLLIAGPTASGKTALAIEAARALDGEIINADSMQIYREIPILSAQPGIEERGNIPHYLFGERSVAEPASVGWWARRAQELIVEIQGRKRTPILIGGTGLYFGALTKGLAVIPPTTNEAREEAERLEALGMEALRLAAAEFDPVAAQRAMGDDRARLRRIVEVGVTTGQAISEFQKETHPVLATEEWSGIVIEPDRAALYGRINARFDAMLEAGALDEARALQSLDRSLPALKAVGLPPLLAHLDGELPLDKACELAKRDSRRYAKRQYTWFRNQCAAWSRIHALDPDRARAEFQALGDR